MKTQVNLIPNAKIETITFEYGDKELSIKIQEPTFDMVVEGLQNIFNAEGKYDRITPGKFVYDLCCIETDPILLTNHKLLVSVCGLLTDLYIQPLEVSIKKKD